MNLKNQTGSGDCSQPGADSDDNTNTYEFSAIALGQIQTDLQNCLSRLSSDIIRGICRKVSSTVQSESQ